MRYTTRASLNDASKSAGGAYTISVGGREWPFTGFFHRHQDDIDDLGVKDAPPTKQPKWLVKKKQKRQAKKERRQARRAQQASEPDSEAAEERSSICTADEEHEEPLNQDQRGLTSEVPESSSEVDAGIERTMKRSEHCKAASSSSKRRRLDNDQASPRGSLSDAEISETESEDDDDPQSFAFDRIVAKRVVRGRTTYKVRWTGYESDDDTWEPIAHLQTAAARAAVDRFNKQAASE